MPHIPRLLRPLSLRFTLMAAISVVIIASLLSSLGHAQDHEQERETSRLLAILFDSGRLVVGMNQDLINDASKGDKGFTPAVFETQMLKVFEQRTGINLSNSSDKLPARLGPSLTAFWRKVRGRSRVTKHRLILLESATRDSSPQLLERKLPNAFRHGRASIFDKSRQKSF